MAILTFTQNNSQNPYIVADRYATTPTNPVYLDPSQPNQQGNGVKSIIQGNASNDFQGTAGISFWFSDPDFWDTITFIMPDNSSIYYGGLCKVSFDKELKIQPAQNQGANGYSIVSLGWDNSKIKLKFYAWKPDHFRCYQIFMKYFKPVNLPTGTRLSQLTATHVTHPKLQCASIDQIFVYKISSLQQEEIGYYSFELDALEWVDPVSKKAQASGNVNPGSLPGAQPTIVPNPGPDVSLKQSISSGQTGPNS